MNVITIGEDRYLIKFTYPLQKFNDISKSFILDHPKHKACACTDVIKSRESVLVGNLIPCVELKDIRLSPTIKE